MIRKQPKENSMELIKSVDSFLESPPTIRAPRHRKGFYPSAASCIIRDSSGEEELVGKCIRANYWACRSVKPTNPMNARGFRITSVGKMKEEWEVSRYKEMGIWRGNNVKFLDTDYNISGEVDAFVWDEMLKDIIGVEIKTGYGYQFEKEVIGKPGRKGHPKLDHLLQVMLYMNYFKDIPMFKLVYFSRGNAARIEFNITLDKGSGQVLVDNKKTVAGLTVPGILHRFNTLDKCLEDGTLPRRDYQLQYTDETIQLMYDANKLNKTQKAAFEKSQKITMGDWRCGYCDYKDYCWKENKE